MSRPPMVRDARERARVALYRQLAAIDERVREWIADQYRGTTHPRTFYECLAERKEKTP